MKHILILSHEGDPHVAHVLPELTKRKVSFVCFDPGDFPQQVTLSASLDRQGTEWGSFLTLNGQKVDGAAMSSIWYRRPRPCQVLPTFPPVVKTFAEQEAQYGLGGLLRCLPGRWVNYPDNNRAASYKPLQLQVAQRLGLEVPRSLLTNDPAAVRDFYTACNGQMILKVLRDGMLDLGEGIVGTLYTSLVTEDTLEHLAMVRHTCYLFQEVVPKEMELRITVFGNQVFAAEIYSQHSPRAQTDWRRSYADLRYGVHGLPKEIEERCLALLRHFGLAFGAIDMILTPDGRYVFLEVNPNGQWAWLEASTGLPLSSALVDLLTEPWEDTHAVC